MKINATGLRNLPKKALKGINEIGTQTIKLAGSAKNVVVEHTPDVIKNNAKTVVGSAVVLAALSGIAGVTSTIVNKVKDHNQGK